MRRLFAAALAAVLMVAGCSSSTKGDVSASATAGDISQITVGTSKTLAPSITWPAGMDFTKAQSTVVWNGKGKRLEDGQPLLLDVYIESLATHQVLKNTYDGLPWSTLLAPEFLGDDLYHVLLTARLGTRVLSVSPSQNEFTDESAIVIVIDVLPDTADGEIIPQDPNLPLVTAGADGEPTIALRPDKPLPTELAPSVLIRGNGPQIVPGSYIVAQYKAVWASDGSKEETVNGETVTKKWKAGDVRQSTWPPERAPFEGQIGKGKWLRGWDEGLIDQTAGSRVMLVVPEAWGYPGEGTIVYVIDILDVWNEGT